MPRHAAGEPLLLRRLHVPLDGAAVLELRSEQDGAGRVSVVVQEVTGWTAATDAPRHAEAAIRLPPRVLREVAAALERLAGELGVQ